MCEYTMHGIGFNIINIDCVRGDDDDDDGKDPVKNEL